VHDSVSGFVHFVCFVVPFFFVIATRNNKKHKKHEIKAKPGLNLSVLSVPSVVNKKQKKPAITRGLLH